MRPGNDDAHHDHCLPILLAHDRWATAQLLDACQTLSLDQFHQRFDMGPGSLHDTITHILGALRAWTDTLAGAELRPRLETDGRTRTPAELHTLLNDDCETFGLESTRLPLGEMVVRTLRDGRSITLTRAEAIMQVTTHGMHHRAQCLNMLRQLGVPNLPPSSVAEWVLLRGPRG